MTARDFCYWLQGFIEIGKASLVPTETLHVTGKQLDMIQKHLALVFVHDIDPKAGDPHKQKVLNDIHNGDLVARC